MTDFHLTIRLAICIVVMLSVPVTALAQDIPQTSTDDSSDRTEESEEAYRRRMELEGARDNETYADTSYGSQVETEKIDKLPRESQENIRDQITDIIIENDEWEPSDVLEDYPYEPTEAAKKDPALRDQEEEAWAEQVDKYHEREAGAFGATRPPMPGEPGQPGQPGSQGSEPQEGGQSGGGQNGSESEGESEPNDAGGFNPGQAGSSSDDETSTAGVSESALDFLRGQRGQSPIAGNGTSPDGQPDGTGGSGGGSGNSPQEQIPALAGGGADQQQAEQAESPAAEDSQPTDNRQQGGTLPIDQLGQLQGVGNQPAGQPDGQSVNESPAGQSQTAQSSGDGSTPPTGQEQASQGSESVSESPADELAAQSEPNSEPSSDQQAADQAEQQAEEQMAQTEQQAAEQAQDSENQEPQSSPDLQLQTPGIIAIRDLEKLEGVDETDGDPP